MIGNVIYPLNHLRQINKEAYSRAVAKYQGRERLMDFVIPKLNCLWNDVVHCLPIHPNLLYKAMLSSGLNPKSYEWYRIDPSTIEDAQFLLYSFKTSPYHRVDPDEFQIISMEEYKEIEGVPQKAFDWYRELAKEGGEIRLPFRYVPHLLVKGVVEISKAEIIHVDGH
jgi:hypothetical protein